MDIMLEGDGVEELYDGVVTGVVAEVDSRSTGESRPTARERYFVLLLAFLPRIGHVPLLGARRGVVVTHECTTSGTPTRVVPLPATTLRPRPPTTRSGW